MISPDKLFGNLFNDKDITPTRLANFGQDVLNKLTASHESNFSPVIERLTEPLRALQQQLSGVDTSVTQQACAALFHEVVFIFNKNKLVII